MTVRVPPPKNSDYRGPLVIRTPVPAGAIDIAAVAEAERRRQRDRGSAIARTARPSLFATLFRRVVTAPVPSAGRASPPSPPADDSINVRERARWRGLCSRGRGGAR
jgi:hypothetical protein